METTSSPTDLETRFANERFTGGRYDIIPWYHRHELLFYREYGSYQGDWLILSYDPRREEYVAWKGSYGSCSGCDHFEDHFGYSKRDMRRSSEQVVKFVAEYPSFLEIPRRTMVNLLRNGTLSSVMPLNAFRDYQDNDYGDVGFGNTIEVITLICKIRENIDVTAEDIYNCENTEVRRRGLESYGEENWLNDMQASLIHEDECGQLYQIRDRRYVLVKDASTPRRFVLRVPSEDVVRGRPAPLLTARAAVAWTFDLQADEYHPVVQT